MVGCAAHARRKFDEALTALPKEQQQTFRAAEALCYFAKLFQLEQSFAELKPEERYTTVSYTHLTLPTKAFV